MQLSARLPSFLPSRSYLSPPETSFCLKSAFYQEMLVWSSERIEYMHVRFFSRDLNRIRYFSRRHLLSTRCVHSSVCGNGRVLVVSSFILCAELCDTEDHSFSLSNTQSENTHMCVLFTLLCRLCALSTWTVQPKQKCS